MSKARYLRLEASLPKPIPWKDDPECGHLVAHSHQTHYCTYIRVPRLIALQQPQSDHPDEILAVLGLQAVELWLKVLLNDLECAAAELDGGKPQTYQPTKLFNRASELLRLLDNHIEVTQANLISEAALRLPLDWPEDGVPSAQLTTLESWNSRLAQPRISRNDMLERAIHEFTRRSVPWMERYRALLSDLFEMGGPPAPDLAEYLHLASLLDLQDGVKGEWSPIEKAPESLRSAAVLSPDELMFIVVHQVFELWFRALLHELDAVIEILSSGQPSIPAAAHRMQRVVRIQKLLAEMILVPATILPMDFLEFRAQTRTIDGVTHERGLSPSSGTESYQFRELEIIAGLRDSPDYGEFLRGNSRMHIRFLTPEHEVRLRQPTLPELFDRTLARRGVSDMLEIFRPADAINPHADLAELAGLLLEFDQYFQLWRVNHLTMVQSMIGRKSGTGFLGPEYLEETVGMRMQGEDERLLRSPQIRPRFFEELWEVRTRMRAEDRGAHASG